MASRQTTVDFVLEQIDGAGVVRAKKMFGEYGIFCDDKMVALICDDQLFVKQTEAGRQFMGKAIKGSPYPGAKECFIVSGDKWDDRRWLTELVRISAAALPLLKRKPARKQTG